LSETHITEEISESHEIQIRGYKTVFSTSHSCHTGGASIYIRDDIAFEAPFCVSESPKWWLSGVKLRTDKGLFKIVCLYRSPSYPVEEFLNFFDKWLEENEEDECKTIVVGDFNINLNKKDDVITRETKDIFQGRGYKQLVNFNTRVAKTSASLIDFVLVKMLNVAVSRHKQHKVGDHETIKIHCDFFNTKRNVPKLIEIRDWKNFNFEELRVNLSQKMVWLNEMHLSNDEKAAALSDIIESLVNALLKHKVIYTSGGATQQPWYTEEMNEQRKCRDRAKEAEFSAATVARKEAERTGAPLDEATIELCTKLHAEYQKERNKYTNMCKKGEKEFYYEKIDKVKNDSAKMWKTLKSLVSENKNDKKSDITVSFDSSFTASTEDNFNYFFVESIESIVKSIPDVGQIEKEMLSDIPQHDECNFRFREIELLELVNIVKNLKSTAVPNNVNLNVLLNIFDTIQETLLKIVNGAIREGSYPQAWKKSMVIPIPKIKTAKEPQEFRPINILPLFEKVLEIVLQKQILEYLKENSILYDLQSGFRENHSCESAIQYILESWRKMAEEGKVTIAVFLDFKRAFETIDRELLLQKLEKYGFSKESVTLLRSFLTDRKQYVFVNGKKSEEINVDIGVPQGSVLGPLLFILYINDLPLQLKRVLVKIFADDTMLSVSHKNYAAAATILNQELEIVTAWLKMNKVKLNASKSKFMVIAQSKNKLTSIQGEVESHQIEIDNEPLERVLVFKYLGVMIDCCLKFEDHVSYVIKKAGKKISYLGRLRNKLSTSTKKLIYNSIVAPHFDYCATVFWQTNEENLQKLQKLQNIAMRHILNCKRRTSTNHMLRELGWLDMRKKLELSVLVMVKKIVNGNDLPPYMSENVKYNKDVHAYETRSRDHLHVKRVSGVFAEKSLCHSGFVRYNSLPNEVKNTEKINAFKGKCVQYLKNQSSVNYKEN
jgi:hypothetical protein